ncbi:hypothetical protein LCGC14_1976490 [marine sediment metagenome]|uniref:Uncharacterized protein n=1 Tax=marine sediment metagenome TaxID=412755 RepID=A0A0F9FYF4_9ZZZZ
MVVGSLQHPPPGQVLSLRVPYDCPVGRDNTSNSHHGVWNLYVYTSNQEKVMPKVVAGRYRDKSGTIRKHPGKSKAKKK